MKPPENVLFVCKLNPITTEEDLEIIFSRFGEIKRYKQLTYNSDSRSYSCEVIKDWKTGESLCYAFIEFASRDQCENAYFKMDNVLIDDRRIHVDFSQSVSKLVMGKDGKAVRMMGTYTVTHCHSLSLTVTRYHSLSLAILLPFLSQQLLEWRKI